MSDVLSNGPSSRLFRRLLKEQQIFSDIDCYITGSLEPGLCIIEGKPADGVSMEKAKAAIWEELELLKKNLIPERELKKLQNKAESTFAFSSSSIMTKSMNLGFFELLGDANLIIVKLKNIRKLQFKIFKIKLGKYLEKRIVLN